MLFGQFSVATSRWNWGALAFILCLNCFPKRVFSQGKQTKRIAICSLYSKESLQVENRSVMQAFCFCFHHADCRATWLSNELKDQIYINPDGIVRYGALDLGKKKQRASQKVTHVTHSMQTTELWTQNSEKHETTRATTLSSVPHLLTATPADATHLLWLQ